MRCRRETARCRYERQTEGPSFPRHISSYRSLIVEIPTAAPTFSGSTRPLEALPTSPDVDLSRKSNMAANKPEVLVSPKLPQISSKFQRLYPLFRVDASTGGTADDARRRSLLQIQHGRQQTGSTIVPPKLRQISSKFQRLHPLFRVDASSGGTADVARRRSLPEIKHGRQQTGSTSISETTTDIVEIPTATPTFPGRRVHWRHCRRRPTSTSPGNQTWPPTNRKY